MGENKLRIALDSGDSMAARRILPQLVTKLAIGLGALFLVGVLLAAIPNHRAPTVEGVSLEPCQEAQGMNRASGPGMDVDTANSNEKDAGRGMTRKRHEDSAHRHASAPKAGDSAR